MHVHHELAHQSITSQLLSYDLTTSNLNHHFIDILLKQILKCQQK
jgi:hypothetical protein